ncbi:MAG: hypothetical protein NTV49_05190 [Kiritimatiellaeota bacterium]|nr:hypothetical protein [Kiritimatiellota bacterium]
MDDGTGRWWAEPVGAVLVAVMGEGAKGRKLLPGAECEPGMVYEPGPTLAARLRTGVGHLEDMTAKTWKQQRAVALAAVRAALAWIESRILHEAPPATA